MGDYVWVLWFFWRRRVTLFWQRRQTGAFLSCILPHLQVCVYASACMRTEVTTCDSKTADACIRSGQRLRRDCCQRCDVFEGFSSALWWFFFFNVCEEVGEQQWIPCNTHNPEKSLIKYFYPALQSWTRRYSCWCCCVGGFEDCSKTRSPVVSLPAAKPAELNGGQSCALMDRPVTAKCAINSFVSLCKDKFGNERSEKEPVASWQLLERSFVTGKV